jgi:ABC-2 type transport system ATP-binding protein
MTNRISVDIQNVSHAYGDRLALDQVSFSVKEGEIFGLLGPNGGGKTTLFRLLSTLLPLETGKASIFGHDLAEDPASVRKSIGVVFQSPSLDKRLKVVENLQHQGHLYGLRGSELAGRVDEALEKVGLSDRREEIVMRLSGGLQRRAEVAKAFLHRPRLLLMDEPTTGLDPGARKDLWDYLKWLREKEGVTILLTTHLMEEAERCDRLGIIHQGKLIALDSPVALRSRIGGEVLIARASNAVQLAEQFRAKFGGSPVAMDGILRVEMANGHEFVTRLVESFPGQIDSVTIGKPTLEDVFVNLTGHRFWGQQQSAAESLGGKRS